MNNSARKSNLINLFNNLSETSNDFLSEINKNFTNSKLVGGSHGCPCMEALKAFGSRNLDLALYILKEKSCCMECKDENENTLLHHLVLCCTAQNNNNKCMQVLNKVLSLPNVRDFIDMQNSSGTTPILMAVENSNEVVANRLDEAGANKSIADNTGNYLQTDDLSESNRPNLSETPNEQVCINNVVKLVVNDKVQTPDLSSLNLNSSVAPSMAYSANLANSINSENSDAIAEKVKDKIVRAFGVSSNMGDLKADDLTSLGLTSSEDYLDSDKFIKFLGDKYNKQPENKVSNLLGNLTETQTDTDETLNSDSIINELTQKLSKNLEAKPEDMRDAEDEGVVDTDTLMQAIDNIKSKKVNVMEGGAFKRANLKEKVMGYRNLVMHSENSEMNVYPRESNKKSNNHYKSDESEVSNESSLNMDLYYSDAEFGNTSNELSRLINSRKNDLHTEVLNTIMGMLNKGLITKNSKPIEANERNAKLIKSFLYRVTSEKNPQLTGMDKIMLIKKMNDKEIVDALSKMPDLDELEETIRKHIESKHSNSNSDLSSSVDSEPTKKKSKKAVQSRSKKPSKKSSKSKSKK
jgi:hypothetical protein